MSPTRRNTMGAVRALDATRARRASQGAAAGRVAGKGQGIDQSGRIVPARSGPEFYQDEKGGLRLRLGQWLHLTPGSQKRIDVEITPEFARAIFKLMVLTGDDVLVPDPENPGTPESPGVPRTVTEGFANFTETFQPIAQRGAASGYPDLGGDGFVPTAQLGSGAASSSTFLRGDNSWQTISEGESPVAFGFTDLSGGTKTVSLPEIVEMAVVQLTHKTISGVAGILSYTVSDGSGFTINSESALDDSTVGYVVWNP